MVTATYSGDVQKYKYNGKELDRFLNWDMLDYGARWYDSKLQCWSTVDPLAEKYYHDAVNLFKEGSKANARGFYNKIVWILPINLKLSKL